MKNTRSRASEELRRGLKRFKALKDELSRVGLFRRGSLTTIYARCGNKRCACREDPSRRHGPYVQWTRKVAGKTVTVRLRRGDEALFEKWIANSRRLDELVVEMHAVSLRATDMILQMSRERRA